MAESREGLARRRQHGVEGLPVYVVLKDCLVERRIPTAPLAEQVGSAFDAVQGGGDRYGRGFPGGQFSFKSAAADLAPGVVSEIAYHAHRERLWLAIQLQVHGQLGGEISVQPDPR